MFRAEIVLDGPKREPEPRTPEPGTREPWTL